MSITFEETAHVEAELNYLSPGGKRPVYYAYPVAPDVPQYGGEVATS